ncbi:MAG TPA: RNA polymerase sigma factor, partial [Verrucomicrobiae bacterium]|nr:RNA polymerase sigma factor [Verrucomicrobiae bacterium]
MKRNAILSTSMMESSPRVENPAIASDCKPEPLRWQTSNGIMDDRQLLSAYIQGDEQAFETLVEKYFRMVYAMAARVTGDSHLAEEIAQSVFLTLSRKAPRFSSKVSISGWLLQATRFICRDAIKMRRRRDQNERKLATALGDALEGKPGPSTMELLLDEAIQALPLDEQAGILARFFEGKNFQEIGAMFAVSEDTAQKRISRSVAKLQAYMARRGVKINIALLAVPQPAQDLHSALQATHAAWKGKIAAENAAAWAKHALWQSRWRSLVGLGLKVALPALIFFAGAGAWSVHEWNRPDRRIERLGKAWGVMARQVARHRQFLLQTPPNAPGYQATVQQQLAAISRQSS